MKRKNKPKVPPDAVAISPWKYIELLWPLNDMFRVRLPEIEQLSYDVRFETEADDALRAYAERPEAGTWATLSPGAWRVLLERHLQMLETATLNHAAGVKVLIHLPPGVTDEHARVGLMLIWLLQMKLPWPPAERSSFALPHGPPVPTWRPH